MSVLAFILLRGLFWGGKKNTCSSLLIKCTSIRVPTGSTCVDCDMALIWLQTHSQVVARQLIVVANGVHKSYLNLHEELVCICGRESSCAWVMIMNQLNRERLRKTRYLGSVILTLLSSVPNDLVWGQNVGETSSWKENRCFLQWLLTKILLLKNWWINYLFLFF